MKIYHYDRETKEYIRVTEAHLDPLETQLQKKNIYLLPAYATFIRPLKKQKGKRIIWDNDKWIYVDAPKKERKKKISEDKEFIKLIKAFDSAKTIEELKIAIRNIFRLPDTKRRK